MALFTPELSTHADIDGYCPSPTVEAFNFGNRYKTFMNINQ